MSERNQGNGDRQFDKPPILPIDRERAHKLVEKDYDSFVIEISTSEQFSGLQEHRNILKEVIDLHPHKDLYKRLSAIDSLSERIDKNPQVRELITPAIIRLLDEKDILYPRQVNIEAVGKLGISQALPKLEEMFHCPSNVHIKNHILQAMVNFSYEQDEVKRIIDAGLEDEDEKIVERTLSTLGDLDIPQEVIDRVWKSFEHDKELFGRKSTAAWLLAKKDPERMSDLVIKQFEETLNIVRPEELFETRWEGWIPTKDMTGEELEIKRNALEKRHDILWTAAGMCVNHLENPEPLVNKLNEWLALKLGLAEDQFIVMALDDHPNLNTIHTIIDRQDEIDRQNDAPLANDTFLMAISMISKHYGKFKDDAKLQEYLDKLGEQEDFSKVVKAIKEDKKLRMVNPPYSMGLAIEE